MYIGIARNAEEVQQAKTLAASIFSGTGGQPLEETLRHKDILWNDPAGVRPGDCVVAVDETVGVVGLVRLVYRIVKRQNQEFTCAGYSSICVDSEWRGKGLSWKLMEQADQVAREAGCEIGLLFARRAVDHYYTRCGFWGLSSYNRILVSKNQLVAHPNESIAFEDCGEKDLGAMALWYNACYGGSFGSVQREGTYWNYLLQKMASMKVAWKRVFTDGQPCGYLIHSGPCIHELAFPETVNPTPILAGLSQSLGEDLEIEIHPDHPLIPYLEPLDFTLKTRQCRYGGHMIKILDVKQAARKLESRIQSFATQSRIRPMTESHDNISTEWDGTTARANVSLSSPILEFQTTARLLGVQTLSGKKSFLDPELSFNVTLPDQV